MILYPGWHLLQTCLTKGWIISSYSRPRCCGYVWGLWVWVICFSNHKVSYIKIVSCEENYPSVRPVVEVTTAFLIWSECMCAWVFQWNIWYRFLFGTEVLRVNRWICCIHFKTTTNIKHQKQSGSGLMMITHTNFIWPLAQKWVLNPSGFLKGLGDDWWLAWTPLIPILAALESHLSAWKGPYRWS